MAEVLLGRLEGPRGFQKPVALKRIRSAHLDDVSFVEMFLDEARIAAQLSHPNIVQIYELGLADGGYFIAMEYVEGRSVFDCLVEGRRRGQRLPLDIALGIIAGACDGLAFAHSREVIHRDVSPQNLIVSTLGHVKILDFGIARAKNRIHRTCFGDVKGKLSYMSPEQALGMDVDRRTDVYALGVVMHELITGRRLVPTAEIFTVIGERRPRPAPPPSQVIPSLPPLIDQLVMRALAYDPGQRFASCDELRTLIDETLVRMGAFNNAPARRARFLAAWFDGAADSTVAEMTHPRRRPPPIPPPDETSLLDDLSLPQPRRLRLVAVGLAALAALVTVYAFWLILRGGRS